MNKKLFMLVICLFITTLFSFNSIRFKEMNLELFNHTKCFNNGGRTSRVSYERRLFKAPVKTYECVDGTIYKEEAW